MSRKKITGFIMGLAALGLQVPGILTVFTSPNGWNFAAVLLAVFTLAAAVLSVLAAISSITRRKKASALFICAGIGGALTLALTLFLLLSFEFTVITTAISIVILFAAARAVKPTWR